MNKLVDLMLATQLSTSFAWICAIGAHLTAKYMNDNWQFAVYFQLVLSVLFMLVPYLIYEREENRHGNW